MIDEKKLIEEIENAGFFIAGVVRGKGMIMRFLQDYKKAIIKCINGQPKVGKWIPVTELDLDHNQEALIKLDDGFICSARFLISDKGNHCGFYHKHVGFLQCPQVVAWMPYNAE